MKIAEWKSLADGTRAWVSDGRILGAVYAEAGAWRTDWREPGHYFRLMEEFACPHDACLAAEKYWPQFDKTRFNGWLESVNGGYFRKFGKKTVCVRKTDAGWYAVQANGKVLGKGGKVSFFPTAEDACVAVEKELHRPTDADPFVSRHDQWQWMKVKPAALRPDKSLSQ